MKEKIICKEIIICDDLGNQRIELRGGNGKTPASISFLQNSRTKFQIVSDQHNLGLISIYDENNSILLSLGGSEHGCGLTLFNKNGEPEVSMALRRNV